MYFINNILIFITLILIASVVSGKKDIVAVELKIPSFVNSIFGIDDSLKTFRASLGPNKDNSDTNDLAIDLSASNQSDSDGDGIQKRAFRDRNLMRVNIVGVNDVASVLQSYIQPYARLAPQSVIDTITSLIRRSSQETKPNVELAPGAIKSEIVTYPPNFLEKRLKYLLQIKKKEEEQEQEQTSKNGYIL